MLRLLVVALAAAAVLTTTAASANAQRQIGKPKFESLKLQTGMGATAAVETDGRAAMRRLRR